MTNNMSLQEESWKKRVKKASSGENGGVVTTGNTMKEAAQKPHVPTKQTKWHD